MAPTTIASQGQCLRETLLELLHAQRGQIGVRGGDLFCGVGMRSGVQTVTISTTMIGIAARISMIWKEKACELRGGHKQWSHQTTTGSIQNLQRWITFRPGLRSSLRDNGMSGTPPHWNRDGLPPRVNAVRPAAKGQTPRVELRQD